MPKWSKYRGFAVLDQRGNLCWGTIKRTEEDAKAAFDKFNPDPTGDGMSETVVPVELYLEKP